MVQLGSSVPGVSLLLPAGQAWPTACCVQGAKNCLYKWTSAMDLMMGALTLNPKSTKMFVILHPQWISFFSLLDLYYKKFIMIIFWISSIKNSWKTFFLYYYEKVCVIVPILPLGLQSLKSLLSTEKVWPNCLKQYQTSKKPAGLLKTQTSGPHPWSFPLSRSGLGLSHSHF